MTRRYLAGRQPWFKGAFAAVVGLGGDYRHPASRAEFAHVIAEQPPDAVCVAIGGGPTRVHPRLVNLNLAPFPNVDVVGTAFDLPFADGSVAAVYCEAVLEHLEFPERAVAEMFRVLRPGGQAFAVTPFLQGFHGYPSHYQNYTLIGHRRLFERVGFETVAAGVCVGPVRALVDIVAKTLATSLPGVVGKASAACWLLFGVLIRPFDLILNRLPEAHRVASTTYVRCRKPAGADVGDAILSGLGAT
jgi:SAM-dependent methyltransferase